MWKRTRDGKMTQRQAAEKMAVSDRWVRALLVELKEKGDAVVVHGLRGQPSNRRIDEDVRKRAIGILKTPGWHDFKPTFATEQLGKRHQIEVSKETVRQWMMAEGLWESRKAKVGELHQWRPRRSHYGELVQWDTSDHDWLEGRGEPVKLSNAGRNGVEVNSLDETQNSASAEYPEGQSARLLGCMRSGDQIPAARAKKSIRYG
jgi:hypothetical protein